MSETLIKYVHVGEIAGARLRALDLFLTIEKHHGEALARDIFAALGAPPSRMAVKQQRKYEILRRYDAMPVKNKSELAATLAEENKNLPLEERGGAGGTNPIALYKFIDRALDERAEGMKAGTWQGPRADGSDILDCDLSRQFRD